MERQRHHPRYSDPTRLAATAAERIAEGFERYLDRFRALTREARPNFERGDWPAIQRDAKNRLDLYGGFVVQSVAAIRDLLGPGAGERQAWASIRSVFERRLALHPERELAETYFNSNVRRIFHTVGVDPLVEFVRAESSPPRYEAPWSFTVTVPREGTLEAAFERLLLAVGLETPWDDLAGDAARAAAALAAEAPPAEIQAIEFVRAPFFRGKGAYLVGQILTRDDRLPLLLALRNPNGRVQLDAALFTEDEFSVVFSFAHTYFFVDLERVKEMVDYLSSILPRKPIADLWSALGFHRHGKTELYRSLLSHLASSAERFQVAVGQRGLVMVVFALPGFDVVFKIIRDRFPPPKTVTHAVVREKYRLVFRHDRAGRLVDAQEFEHLEFPLERFTPDLLEELRTSASEQVEVRADTVVLRHLYTERQLVPLDVFLTDAPPGAARAAVRDYGQVVKDLAATNIFPGDMLLKNFGVSRHGRVIFYDYDELCLLTECRFRNLPPATTSEEEVALEPWYFVGENDIFPEEFRSFLGLKAEYLDHFLAAHGELLEPAFWWRMQELHRRGVVPDIYPYPAARRLRPDDGRGETR